MRRLLIAAAMLVTATGAQAADMPDFLRGSLPAGPSPQVNWQGYYIGGQGSYGSASSKVTPTLNSDLENTFLRPGNNGYNWQDLGQAKNVAAGYGGFVGYNTQWEDVVVGVEANYLHSDYHALTTATGITIGPSSLATTSSATSNALVSLTDFGSVRLRAGYIMGCFLPYVFGGGGLGNQTIDRSVYASPAPIFPPLSSNTKSTLVYGYSAGAGVDVMLFSGLFLRAEYEYQRVTASFESNINSGKIGIGYKF